MESLTGLTPVLLLLAVMTVASSKEINGKHSEKIKFQVIDTSATNCSSLDNFNRWNELSTAVRSNDIPTVVRVLKRGICIRCLTHVVKQGILHTAVEYNAGGYILKKLVDSGADVNCQDNERNTPLHNAASGCKLFAVKALLSMGSSVNAKNYKGMTPLHLAVLSYCNSTDVLKELVKHGADMNTVDNSGSTPLVSALTFPMYDKLKTLLDLGADLNFTDPFGMNVLHEAAYRSEARQIPLLIQRKVCIDCQESSGWTALHLAAMVGSLDSARHLIEAGAAVNIRDQDGNTPLFYAQSQRRKSVEEYIKLNGGEE